MRRPPRPWPPLPSPYWLGRFTDAEAAELEILLAEFGEPGNDARAAALIAYTVARSLDRSHQEAPSNARHFGSRQGVYNQSEKRIKHQRTRRNTR